MYLFYLTWITKLQAQISCNSRRLTLKIELFCQRWAMQSVDWDSARGSGAKNPSACVICLWPQWGYSLAWVAQFSRSLFKDRFGSHTKASFFSTHCPACLPALLHIAPANLLEKVLAIERNQHITTIAQCALPSFNWPRSHSMCWAGTQ
jgi:hypothetical protein